ncbi:hypothetical protein V5O48_019436, partial [Marasmius crinis-equi]
LALLTSDLGGILREIKSAVARLQHIYTQTQVDNLLHDSMHISIALVDDNDEEYRESQSLERSRSVDNAGTPFAASSSAIPQSYPSDSPARSNKVTVQFQQVKPATREVKEPASAQPRPKKKKKKNEIDAIFDM